MRQAIYNAVIRLWTNIELLRFWAWSSFKFHLRCGQKFLMWPFSGGSNSFASLQVLKPMIRCGKNLFQITSIWRCFVVCLFQLGHNRLEKNRIAFKLAVITKVRQGLKHLVLQYFFFGFDALSSFIWSVCKSFLFGLLQVAVTVLLRNKYWKLWYVVGNFYSYIFYLALFFGWLFQLGQIRLMKECIALRLAIYNAAIRCQTKLKTPHSWAEFH